MMPVWQRVTVSLAAVVVVAVGVFTWNEARKEIVFLCANFTPGVEGESVRRQLDTGDFLRYRQRVTDTGSRIVADSAFTVGLHSCVIELDDHDRVVTATLP